MSKLFSLLDKSFINNLKESFYSAPNNSVTTTSTTASQYFNFDLVNKSIKYIQNDSSPLDVIIPVQINGNDILIIDDDAFRNMNIKSVRFEQGSKITTIDNNAFYGCTSLTSIILPPSLTTIDSYAFSKCSSLTSIKLPPNLTNIENSAFGHCNSLISIEVDINNNNYSSINGVLFNKTNTLLIKYPQGQIKKSYLIPASVNTINANAFSNCTKLTNIIIQNGVITIDHYAFVKCTALKSITIPFSVTNIGDCAFHICTKLTSIYVNNNNNNYISIDGVLFNKNKTKLIKYPEGINKDNYTITDNVTSMSADAFAYCNKLTSITILGNITNISNNAFLNCHSLQNITLPSSITTINESAFSYCISLTNITIPANVTTIENNAFFNCIALNSIIFDGKLPSLIKDTSFLNIGNNINVYHHSWTENDKNSFKNLIDKSVEFIDLDIKKPKEINYNYFNIILIVLIILIFCFIIFTQMI